MTYTYAYPRPALTVDCVLFGVDEEEDLKVLLIQRDREPFAGRWAFPGGFVDEDEDIDQAARRELEEETGLSQVPIVQFHTFGALGRDPRGRTVSVAYYALVSLRDTTARAASDARDAAWFPMGRVQNLAFDHDHILAVALARLREDARIRPLGQGLLPPTFPLRDLRHVYETVLGRQLDGRAFRRKILKTGLLEVSPERTPPGSRKGAVRYRFDRTRYSQLAERGMCLDLR